jgi:hypothetical protein
MPYQILMEQSPCEAKSHWTSREISRLLWNPKDRYGVHNSPPLVPTLIQMHPIHNFPPYFPNIDINIIFTCTPMSPSGLFPSGFLTKMMYAFLSLPSCYLHRLSHPPWCDHPNNIWRSVQAMKFFIIQCYPASRHFLPLKSKYSSEQPVFRYVNIEILRLYIANFTLWEVILVEIMHN